MTTNEFYVTETNEPPREPQTTAVLELLGREIHSLPELREYCDMESLLHQLESGVLLRWLEQHYYEREAALLAGFSVNCAGDKHRLCSILGVDESLLADWLTDAEQERLSTVKQFTKDETVLKKFRQIALTQEELARQINAGETDIILCHGTFSIPIRKPGLRYLILPGATVESIYTVEQYRKAGVLVEGIALPLTECAESIEPARRAAVQNGYDFYGEDHSAFAGKMHALLSGIEYSDTSGLFRPAHTRCELYPKANLADCAGKRAVRECYEQAQAFFSKELVHRTASFYRQKLEHVFSPFFSQFKALFDQNDLMDGYAELDRALLAFEAYFASELEDELAADPQYYKLYEMSYFMEKIGVEAAIPPKNAQGGSEPNNLRAGYRCIGIEDALREIEEDAQKMADTFYRAAKTCFDTYCGSLERVIERLGERLPKMKPAESLNEYYTRAMKLQNAL